VHVLGRPGLGVDVGDVDHDKIDADQSFVGLILLDITCAQFAYLLTSCEHGKKMKIAKAAKGARVSDLTAYIEKRKSNDLTFSEGFDSGYADFKIGVLLRQARESAGLTQEQVATQLGTKKSVISRIENHADNVTLTTLKQYARAVGRNVKITLVSV